MKFNFRYTISGLRPLICKFTSNAGKFVNNRGLWPLFYPCRGLLLLAEGLLRPVIGAKGPCRGPNAPYISGFAGKIDVIY